MCRSVCSWLIVPVALVGCHSHASPKTTDDNVETTSAVVPASTPAPTPASLATVPYYSPPYVVAPTQPMPNSASGVPSTNDANDDPNAWGYTGIGAGQGYTGTGAGDGFTGFGGGRFGFSPDAG